MVYNTEDLLESLHLDLSKAVDCLVWKENVEAFVCVSCDRYAGGIRK